MMKYSFHSVYAIALIVFQQFAAAQTSGWLNPDSSSPDFSQTYHAADAIVISWQGLNQSMSDLWLASYDTTNDYALRIAANINITASGTLPWTVTVNETEIDIDNQFQFHFIPTGTSFHALQSDQFASPGFLLLRRGEVAPASTVFTITNSLSAITSTTATSPVSTSSASGEDDSDSDDDTLEVSPGLGVGIAIAAVATVIVIVGLLLWVVRLRRRVKAASNQRSAGIVPPIPENLEMTDSGGKAAGGKRISGLHEVVGDRLQPIELAAKRETRVYYELDG